jgi:hypothetical protein
MNTALVDSDIVCYRVGFASEMDSEPAALDALDNFITDLMITDKLSECMEFKFYLTGKTNFRTDIAVTKPYKGNRKGKDKPKHIEALRHRFVEVWEAEVSEGCEADDLLAIKQTEMGDDSVIVSLDKDLDMVKGWHYNFLKDELYYTTAEEGMRKFYIQLLMGDATDNIQGVHRVGIKKAEAAYEGVTDEQEYWDIAVEMHGSYERALEDARLLWMQTKKDELWLPPNERK